jgi:riboflavin kinase/FMN adenylyltransferase
MNVVSWNDYVHGPSQFGSLAAAVGVFDGMHIGHQELIRAVKKRPGLRSAVVTFTENPKRFFRSSLYPGDIMTLRQRLESLEAYGVDVTILIDFSSDFSKLTGREFLSLLNSGRNLSFLVIGQNFRCGQGLDTGSREIKEFCAENGIEMELVRPIRVDGQPVSSSRIRSAIKDGRLEDAKRLMGRPFEPDLQSADITVEGGVQVSNTQIAPPDGTYIVELGTDALRRTTRAQFHEGSWSLIGSDIDKSGSFRVLQLVSRE